METGSPTTPKHQIHRSLGSQPQTAPVARRVQKRPRWPGIPVVPPPLGTKVIMVETQDGVEWMPLMCREHSSVIREFFTGVPSLVVITIATNTQHPTPLSFSDQFNYTDFCGEDANHAEQAQEDLLLPVSYMRTDQVRFLRTMIGMIALEKVAYDDNGQRILSLEEYDMFSGIARNDFVRFLETLRFFNIDQQARDGVCLYLASLFEGKTDKEIKEMLHIPEEFPPADRAALDQDLEMAL